MATEAKADYRPEGLAGRSQCGHIGDCGCEGISNCCFICPLPACRYDLPEGIRTLKIMQHRDRVLEMTQDGHSRREIAEDVGVTVRTISRIRELERC